MNVFKTLLFLIVFQPILVFSSVLDGLKPLPDTNIKDVEKATKKIVVYKRQIKLPEYPKAFNPSIIKYKGGYLLAFRYCPIEQEHWRSYIGIVELNQSMEPCSKPQIIWLREKENSIPHQNEDPRLIVFKNNLYLMFNDNPEDICPSAFHRRDLYLAKIVHNGTKYVAEEPTKLVHTEEYNKVFWQKNWSPFEWKDQLCMSYYINPHEVLLTNLGSGDCTTFSKTRINAQWKWGHLRGGTPAQLVDGQYLAFFHSAISTDSKATHPQQKLLHYYMGAYTFAAEPPFKITKMSPYPIVSRRFYTKSQYDKRVIFPSGFVTKGEYIYVSYGKDDCEMWICAISKKGLMSSLKAVN